MMRESRGVVTISKVEQGQWVAPQYDVAADYRRVVGTAPRRITGIAVAVDTDNMGKSTISYFGDIRFTAMGTTP